MPAPTPTDRNKKVRLAFSIQEGRQNTAARKRILFVSHSSELYGAERSLLEIVLGLPTEVAPIVLLPSMGAMGRILIDHGVQCVVIPHRGWLAPNGPLPVRLARGAYRTPYHLAALAKTLHLLRDRKLDLVYTNTLYSPLGGLVALARQIPHIWHCHELVDERVGVRFDYGRSAAMRFVDGVSDAIIFNSEALRQRYRGGLQESKLTTVYNGVSTVPAFPVARRTCIGRRTRLGIIGSIRPHKGQHYAIRAVSELVRAGHDAGLNIVGDGDDEYISRLRGLATELEVSDRIIWNGFSDDVSHVLRDIDILLVCTNFEAFGRVAVEAMSVGCPVIAANAGGVPEVIESGKTGLLYAPGDFRGLARQILRLVGNPDLYLRISENAVRSVQERFSKERCVDEILQVIERVSERRPQAR